MSCENILILGKRRDKLRIVFHPNDNNGVPCGTFPFLQGKQVWQPRQRVQTGIAAAVATPSPDDEDAATKQQARGRIHIDIAGFEEDWAKEQGRSGANAD